MAAARMPIHPPMVTTEKDAACKHRSDVALTTSSRPKDLIWKAAGANIPRTSAAQITSLPPGVTTRKVVGVSSASMDAVRIRPPQLQGLITKVARVTPSSLVAVLMELPCPLVLVNKVPTRANLMRDF